MTQAQPQQQQPQNLNIGINPAQLQDIARKYTSFRPIIGWIAPMFGFKIPKELDEFMANMASGSAPPTQAQLESMQGLMQGQLPQAPQGIGVGEPVMTYKMMRDAYLMHQDGTGTREIAEAFTAQGSPVSHATVARWINEYDDMMHASKALKLIKIGKYAGFIGALALYTWVIHTFL